MKKRIAIAIVVNIMLYLIFFKLIPYFSDKYHGCYIYQDIYNQSIKSTVLDKFIDSKNHNIQTIIFFGSTHKEETMIFPGYLQDMYDYLNVGDSIVKEKNSIYYRVKSATTAKDTVFKLENTCKENLAKWH